jgi:hypothetical protein
MGLALTATVLALLILLQQPPVNRNALAIGGAARVEGVDLALQPPTELDFLSKADILQRRQAAVMQYPELLSGSYTPAPAVFGQIVDGRPWWGLEGQFFYGQGEQSIAGLSEEARFIVNPYLLVAVDFHVWWGGQITAAELPTLPLTCQPQTLRWQPRAAWAEASYSAACIARQMDAPFYLVAYNARDLGLNYLYLSYADSNHIYKENAPQAPLKIPQFIHRGGSCGYPGGCNNMSPYTAALDDLRITALPAHLVIWLWKTQPASLEQAPDLIFVIKFE